MYVDDVIKHLGVTQRTAAFIVKIYAESEGYNHIDEPQIAVEHWSERFLRLPPELQSKWVRKGLTRLADIDYANHRLFAQTR